MITLTPSHIIEYLYCPRFTYFEYVLGIPQYEDRHFKVQKGRDVHEDKASINKSYLRKKIGVVDKWLDQYLTNELMRGVVDEVLFLKDATMAPLDYKFAKYEGRIYETYRTQLYCYAVLIEVNFEKPVHKGYLVYTRSKNKLVELEITASNKELVKQAITAIQQIIGDNFFPKATKFKKRCLNCTYRNICIR